MSTEISKEEYACLYAAMILQDDGGEITPGRISSLVSAAGITVEPIYTTIVADLLKDINISDLMQKMICSSAPAAAPVAAVEQTASKKEEPTKKKEEEKEESGEGSDFGLGLFD